MSKRPLLSGCVAYVIGRSDRFTAELETVARRMGFGHIATLVARDLGGSGDLPLKFFLLDRRLEWLMTSNTRDVLRGSPDPNVRLAPIILFAEDCDVETYLEFVRLGFDDVLTLPDKRELLIERLEAQINTNHMSYKTALDLGPDRRRMEAADHRDPRRGGELASHARHTVYRTVEGGSTIIRSEIFRTA